MKFYISKLAQKIIIESFEEAGCDQIIIRLKHTEDGLEFFSVDASDYNEAKDLILLVNTIKILVDESEVVSFDRMHLDYSSEKLVFYFYR